MSKSCAERIGPALDQQLTRFAMLLALVDARVCNEGDLDRLGLDDLEELCETLDLHPHLESVPIDPTDEDDREEAWCMLAREQIASLVDDEYMWPETASEVLLGVSKKIVYDVELSTGGPADGFEVEVDERGNIVDIEYYYSDWYDGARQHLRGEAYDTAERALAYIVAFEC